MLAARSSARLVTWGKFKPQSTYFYLSEFVGMDVINPPDPTDLTAKVPRLHLSKVFPTGRFGFHVPTCDGKMAHTVEWEDSWAVYFSKLLLGVANLARKPSCSCLFCHFF